MITKGEWKAVATEMSPNLDIKERTYAVMVNFDMVADCRNNDSEYNAKLIALAGNLAQKHNLEALPEVVKVLREYVNEWFFSDITGKLKEALDFIEVKQNEKEQN